MAYFPYPHKKDIDDIISHLCMVVCEQQSVMKFSEADVQSFSEKQENANTKNKTSYMYNLKLFKEFLAYEEEIRKLKKFLLPSCKNLR